MDKTESKKIAQAFLNRKEILDRFQTSFSGTWKTNMEDFFPLLCPARKADWIPGWTADILYSVAEGLVSTNCLFQTNETNTVWGSGFWYCIGYEKKKFVEALRFNSHTIMQMRVAVKDNKDGTVTATWHIINSAITKKGNQEIEEFKDTIKKESGRIPMLIGHYLETGRIMEK
ncbi:MAG: hypothetical protein PVI26_14750 [Chitinispirillia bacterium]|jgi:hypothetical protein